MLFEAEKSNMHQATKEKEVGKNNHANEGPFTK